MRRIQLSKKRLGHYFCSPQVKHRFSLFKQSADEAHIPIELIKPTDYSPLGGKNLLKIIESLS